MANRKDTIIVGRIIKNRVWRMLRFTAFITRRWLSKHRKLGTDMQVMSKRRNKNLMFHYKSKSSKPSILAVKEYEFSCSGRSDNSIPGFELKKTNLVQNFIAFLAGSIPCIYIDERQMDFTEENITSDNVKACEFPCYVDEDWRTACSSPTNSSRWSLEEEKEQGEFDHTNEVDRQADAFIAKFYNEIELQRQSSLCQYQDMLARGAS